LEQIQGLGTDARSDLYSLGATIYHLMTGTKPPDALSRAAALVNGQPDPLLKPSEATASIAPELDQVLMKAMAQNREQRYATAADMRNALRGANQASTVVDRSEAQTVLFPPPPSTVIAPGNATTQTVVGQPTVGATGETTVVRPLQHKRNEPVTQVTVETPSPIGGPAVSTPSPNPVVVASPELPAQPAPTATPKRSPRNEEARKEPTPKATPEAKAEAEGHEEDPPDVPVPPNFDPNRRPRPRTRPLPVIRNLPDGSQIITMPDGMRVMVTKDGKRTILSPPRPRRQPAPSPSP
jgi:serine/threonine protein kinase